MGPLASVALGLLGYLAASPFLEAAEEEPVAYSNPCPEHWLFYEGSCYGYFPDKKCWKEAESACQEMGAHLASIQSKGECCHLRKYLSRYRPDGDVWIGLHNPKKSLGSTDAWQWSDGSFFDHSQWSEGQPNNYGKVGEFCTELWKSTGFRKWNDESCRRENSFVCKYELAGEQGGAACE
ncbi:C-type lectin BpLec-like [Hemicordylus capensis]|uniref:C-type lectin BpLec-like n=1 Tax=Hemicordylus capensis TaxID=884348 RepID=UPI002303F7A5|nr:C-type lectin BpLec-like [Hemicordylus capensis]